MTTAMDRKRIPLDAAHGWPATVVHERPPRRPETKLPEFEERAARRLRGGQEWRPARDILAREGTHLRPRRVHITTNVTVWIVMAYIVTATLLALLATWAHGVTQPEPSPFTVSVMENSPAVFLAELLGMHGGSAR